MIILYWMTPDPVVATEEMTLLEVRDLLVDHQIRRVPVVQNADELCGIIGRSDLYRFVRPDQLFGDLDEDAKRELSTRHVGDEMTRDPETCSAHDHIEDICSRMSRDKLGAYPVLSRGHLVGMISESDLMRAIAELSYQSGAGKRITVKFGFEEEGEVLYRIVDLARRSHLNLLAVLTHRLPEESVMMATIRVEGDGVEKFVKALWDANYKVIDVS